MWLVFWQLQTPNTMFLPMLMKWALNGFGRNHLQRLAEFLSPFMAIYLSGKKYVDPIDNRGYRSLLPYGYVNPRPNALAPGSLSLERHRLLYLYFKEHTDLLQAPLKVLHIAPEVCLRRVLQRQDNLEYVTADLCSPWAQYHFDVHAIPFRDETFDVVIANHLLEHVQDDARVMAEFYRVMKMGGWGIFQVPMDEKINKTTEDPFLETDELREKYFGQKDHVRLYGNDYVDRLSKAGFVVKVVRLVNLAPKQNYDKYAIDPREPIVVCRKQVDTL